MKKIKSLNFRGFFTLVKCALLGIIVTLIGTIIFSIILKFSNISSTFISYINNFIKAISIFIMILSIKKNNEDRLLIKSICAGIIYFVLSFLIFSILSGGFTLDLSVLFNLLFIIIVSIVVAVITNIFSSKKV